MANKPQSNPFDPGEMLALFDPTKMMGEFTKALQSFSLPGLDMSELLESQSKNMKALTEANRIVMEGAQAVAQRQTEVLQEAATEAATAAQRLAGGDPVEFAGKQSELMAQAYQQAVGHVQEVSETVRKAQAEALATLNKRWQESVAEIQSSRNSQ